MQKVLWFVLAFLFAGFIVIQFIQPPKNTSKNFSDHFLEKESVPPSISKLLKQSCLDCHSYNTKYNWYHKVSPVSWLVNKHVEQGKEKMNLSDWGTIDVFDKIKILEEICRETERKTMPLKSYKLIHPDAKLSKKQITELCDFTTQLSEKLLSGILEI